MENSTSTSDNTSKNENSMLYFVLLGFIFFFQYFSKSKEVLTKFDPVQKKIGDKLFWKFLIVLQLGKCAQWALSPYHFEFFESYHHYSHSTIAKLMALSFLSSSFIGTVIAGYINDNKKKSRACGLYGVTMILSALLRIIKNDICIAISQIVFGLSSSMLYSSFENWFVTQCNRDISDKETRDAVMTNSFEKNAIADAVSAMATNFLVSRIKKIYGITSPIFVSTFIAFIVIILVSILYTDSNDDTKSSSTPSKKNSLFSNILSTTSYISSHPIIFLIGLTESLIFSSLHIFGFVWTPTLKELNPSMDNGKVFTMMMMGLMAGGTSFRVLYSYYSGNAMNIARTLGLFASIGLLLSIIRVDFNNVVYGFLCYEAAIGMFYPCYSKIKAELLPKEHRGTMMILFKMPFNVMVAALFFGMKNWFDIKEMRVIAFAFVLIAFTIQLVAFKGEKKEEKKKNN